jgi:phage repressor protein C with HTH and peptisase S24 domain
METTIKERLVRFIKYKRLSQKRFEEAVGLSNGYVNNISKGIGAEKLQRILGSFPELNQDWLLTGEGEMLLAGKPENTDEEEATNDTRPRLPVTVAAGMLAEYIGGIMAHQCEQMPVIRNFPTYDFTMIVKGDSMEPKFEGGDEIACTRVYSIVEWGKVYLIDTKDGAFLKRIYEEGDSLRCVSYNKEYPDFIVPKCEVNGIYRVVGLLRF